MPWYNQIEDIAQLPSFVASNKLKLLWRSTRMVGDFMQVIECRDVSKEYGSSQEPQRILSNINLQINQSDFVGIVGPSGSGKTTLLYVLSGLEKATSGIVSLFGTPIPTLSDQLLANYRKFRIGFVFQFYNLVPNLNVYENILLAQVIAHKQDKERIARLLDLVGMTGHEHKFPNELSGGMQQRVAIARSLINDPDILFADEPTGNLDSANGKEIMALLRKLNVEQKKTIVLVTHSDDNLAYCTRKIRLSDGKILQDEIIPV